MNRQEPFTDWDEFEKSLLRQFSNMPDHFMKHQTGRHSDWVGEYVQKMLKKHLPKATEFTGFPVSNIEYDMFETHREVIVRCKLPKNVSADDIHVAVNRRKMKLRLGKRSEEILLNKEIHPNRAEAEIRGGSLEIRIPKSGKKEQFHDVPIV